MEEGKKMIFPQIFGKLFSSFVNFLANSRKYGISTISLNILSKFIKRVDQGYAMYYMQNETKDPNHTINN